MTDKLKAIQGGKKPRRYDEHGFPFCELEDLEPPFFLVDDETATAEWNRLAPMLHEQGVLRASDLMCLGLICQQFSICVSLQQAGVLDLESMQLLKELYAKFFLKPPKLEVCKS